MADNNPPENKPAKKRRRLSDLPALSDNTKDKMAEKINYYKTMPNQILENASDLEGHMSIARDKHTTYNDLKSTIHHGKISIVNISDKVDPESFKQK
ncbi:MAG: hypothetical protein HRT47_07645 [Candidatus Caenarcaniphilales bacterium]|nr:hypothetical protein [Candidatus Caenarcaniphilales bacterium]